MAWNRSSEISEFHERKKAGDGLLFRNIIVVVIVGILIAGIVSVVLKFMQNHNEGVLSSELGNSRLITAHHQSIYQDVFAHSSFRSTNTLTVTKDALPPTIENADVFLSPRKSVLSVFKRPPDMIFTNEFENFISDVLSATPGERFLEVDLDETFDVSFQQSLQNEIIISPDDSEDVAMIKEAVKEAKEQIRKHVGEGGSPRDLVLLARSELNKIADYRDKLKENLMLLASSEKDPDIVKLYIEESNRQLAEYGALPLESATDDEHILEFMAAQQEIKLANDAELDQKK